MDSAGFQFILFGLAAALVSNLGRSARWRSFVLGVASAVFLGLLVHDLRTLLPFCGFLLLGYLCLLLIERGWPRSLAWLLGAVIFVYVWLKKYTFLPEASFLHFPYFVLGLSYIFYRVLHLLIEAGDRAQKQHVGFWAYLLYTLNFTTFVSGPIQRYDEFAQDQFAAEPLPLGPQVVGFQLERIVRGFFKVNVLGMLLNAARVDTLASLSAPLPAAARFSAALELVLVYPLFIYCNFSGYIDIVIALARLMRVRLPENFNRPFSTSSVLDFWNRWHMSLSNWFKAYVYNPLLVALMRRFTSVALEPLLAVFCFFVTFFLLGIWHGRTSEFIVFGVVNGVGVSVNKLWQIGLTRRMGRKGYKELAKDPLYRAFGRGLNFIWFGFALFWFWADWQQIHRIFGALSAAQWAAVWLTAWVLATAVLALWEWLRGLLLSITYAGGPVLASGWAHVVYGSALGLVSLAIVVLLSQPAPGIVYKAF